MTPDSSTTEGEDRATEQIEIDVEAHERLATMAEHAGVDVATFVDDLAMALPFAGSEFPAGKWPLTENDWAMDRCRVRDSDARRTDFYDSGYELSQQFSNFDVQTDGGVATDHAEKFDPQKHVRPHPDCEMPECVGDSRDETHAVRDADGNVLEMCDSCLDSGWAADVEVLD